MKTADRSVHPRVPLWMLQVVPSMVPVDRHSDQVLLDAVKHYGRRLEAEHSTARAHFDSRGHEFDDGFQAFLWLSPRIERMTAQSRIECLPALGAACFVRDGSDWVLCWAYRDLAHRESGWLEESWHRWVHEFGSFRVLNRNMASLHSELRRLEQQGLAEVRNHHGQSSWFAKT